MPLLLPGLRRLLLLVLRLRLRQFLESVRFSASALSSPAVPEALPQVCGQPPAVEECTLIIDT
jgi:hypothetical protein